MANVMQFEGLERTRKNVTVIGDMVFKEVIKVK